MERAFQAADGGTMTLDHLPVEILDAPALRSDVALSSRPTLDEVERRYIAATLRHVRGSQTDAARILGISRKALWEKRKRYGLD
jgi:DNA-binding NtrC family response regulator